MRKKIIILVLLLLVIGGIGINNFFSTRLPQRKILFGAWTEGMYDAKTQKLHPEKLSEFEKMIDKKVVIAHYYRGWESFINPNLITEFTILRSHGWTPMLNANPYYFSQCPPTKLPLYKAIAEGKCDAFLHKAGKNLSKIKQPFYLLFAWEMNNKDLEWSVRYSGSSPQDFIKAWRHIHDIFVEEKATNIVWVFCPNTKDQTSVSYGSIYPGDRYVDWIGIDGYNWGTSHSWSQWSSFAGVFTSSYNQLVALAPKKPMMIAEVNSTDQGGNKGEWYKDMLTQQIPYHFPQVKAVILFNENRSKQDKVNWRIDVTKDSLRDFISAIHTNFYQ